MKPTQRDSRDAVPDISAILALLDRLGPNSRLASALNMQKLQDNEATTGYAQAKGYPNLTALQIGEVDKDRDERMRAFEQAKSEQVQQRETDGMGRALDHAGGFMDDSTRSALLQRYLQSMGITPPVAPENPLVTKLKKHQQPTPISNGY